MNQKKETELYLHIPFCMKKCGYCDFLSFTADERTQEAYTRALIKELDFYGKKYKDRLFTTVYIGGGTPSWISEEAIACLMGKVRESFLLSDDVEITMECNPGTVTERKLSIYRRAGINRLSIGLQSAHNNELKILGRIHTWEQFLKTYNLARESGYSNLNIDLMSSLPGQTPELFADSLKRALRLRPEHISSYSLIIEKGTPFYDKYRFDAVRQQAGLPTESLPTEEEEYETIKLTRRILQEAGYRWYEVSNFALPGRECRHNIGYWKRTDYLGVGLGAASLIDNIRYSNTVDLYDYLKQCGQIREGLFENTAEDGTVTEVPAVNLHASAEALSRNAQMEEFMFLGLRMTDGVLRSDFEDAFGISIEAAYGEVMERLKAEGLLNKMEGRVFLTERGMDVSNFVLAQFLH